MSYEAVIAPITNLRPIEKADRLVAGTVAGYQVVTSKDTVEGTVGVFFQEGGQVSLEYARANNLHRHGDLNEDKSKTGLFDDNRRIRAQRLRGAISEGFWAGLSTLEFTGVDVSKLKVGFTFDELNKIPICNKYYTKATRQAMAGGGKTSKKGFKPSSIPDFKEHYDTKQLRLMIGNISKNSIISISEKVHGTSGRTGYLPQIRKLNWFQKLVNKTIGKLGLSFDTEKYIYISGTRKVVLDPKKSIDAGFYSGKKFRITAHNKIKAAGLFQGETIFYELVGFDEEGGYIMTPHGIEDKKLKKQYGDRMCYTYGCLPGETKILVYRITRTTPDGHVTELPWFQMVDRCEKLGLQPVPLLEGPFIYDGDQEALRMTCERLSQGPSILDKGHIREGVVVRVEAPNGSTVGYKYKSFWFAELEGISKNTETYIDMEEIS